MKLINRSVAVVYTHAALSAPASCHRVTFHTFHIKTWSILRTLRSLKVDSLKVDLLESRLLFFCTSKFFKGEFPRSTVEAFKITKIKSKHTKTLIKNEPQWTHMGPAAPTWAHMAAYGPIWAHGAHGAHGARPPPPPPHPPPPRGGAGPLG